MTPFIILGNIVTYDFWTVERSTIGVFDDFGNCVPMGINAYDFFTLGYYK